MASWHDRSGSAVRSNARSLAWNALAELVARDLGRRVESSIDKSP
jgi:hypothetical protein